MVDKFVQFLVEEGAVVLFGILDPRVEGLFFSDAQCFCFWVDREGHGQAGVFVVCFEELGFVVHFDSHHINKKSRAKATMPMTNSAMALAIQNSMYSII